MKKLILALVIVGMAASAKAQTNLTVQWGWQDITNALSLVKRVEVDSGLADHFSGMSVLAASPGQQYVLATLRRGAWEWEILSVAHSDSFFPGNTEDEFGVATSLIHKSTPKVIVNAVSTIKPEQILDLKDFTLRLGVFSETSHLFRGSFESDFTGVRLTSSWLLFN